MINWISLFEDEGIHYVTAGRNTSKGWISIKCPMCSDDESEHMGINLSHGNWSCWRDTTHKGANPERLLIALLGVSKAAARLLIEAYSAPAVDDFLNVGALTTPPEPEKRPRSMPREFKPIKYKSATHKYWQYLYNRGFDNPDQLIEDYQLRACSQGSYSGRLIIPVFDEKGLVGWQGRLIGNHPDKPRYKTSSTLVKKTIFNLQNLTAGKTLYICEGPFDSIKIDFFGKKYGVRSTCLFGVNFTFEQVNKLTHLFDRFERMIVLFDSDSSGVTASFQLADYLPIEIGCVPNGMHDPGSMSKKEIEEWLHG